MIDTSQKLPSLPRVNKEGEFALMCELIELGLWRTSNLARACNVARETIDDWKKRPEAQKAYQKAVKDIISKRKKIGDPEKIMKELNLDVDRTEVDVTSMGQPILGGASVQSNNSNQETTQSH